MTIQIFVTGGTLDKQYKETTGKLVFKKTHLPKMLKLGRADLDVKIKTLMMLDSLQITDYHRNIILENCQKSQEDKIIIVHGSDTMAETAKFLGQRIKNKTIVLTGSMVPYSFESSDGMFNLGSALAFVQTLPYGVYVSMNGKNFYFDNVRKNKASGKFEKIK